MRDFYNQSQTERRGAPLSDTAELWLWSTTISIFCIGGAMGALSAGYLSDVLGRKGAMLLTNVFSILGGLLMGLSYFFNNYEMVIIGRFVIGYYAGVGITIVPLYLVEISPVNLRGAIATIHQLLLTIGIVVAQILGIYAFDYKTGWPILVFLTAVPSIIQLFILPFCPESPRWYYLMSDDKEKCRKEAEQNKNNENVTIMDVLRLRKPEWKRPLFISIGIHIGQQLTGVNAVFVVEKLGRRSLLLYPFIIVTVVTALLTMSLRLQEDADGWKWFSLVMIYVFIIAFAIGPGSTSGCHVHLSTSELVQQLHRGLNIPLLQDTIGSFAFLVFGVCSLLTTIFIFLYIPETKGRTFENIVAGFRGRPVKEEMDPNKVFVTDGTVNQAFQIK
ncbi:putative solute carrier family 2, facilitated glucose transporter member 1 [Apostichopus japonicus]|uniref:Putative solute carrier family 2, facilitated glucose transporter member 1 n=1 Tax=Stichopus japonicus TaxID=307972 RepID=A0A2G8LL93_STIJA|nr:putative solute carrier family 2, facilitated glucose transporter member 1 [Apostichopus japonicus]